MQTELSKSLLRHLQGRAKKNEGPKPIEAYQGRFRDFLWDAFEICTWSKMEEIAEAYEDPTVQEIYIVACHGVSKTMTTAALAEYHCSVMGYPVYTTAPTSRQVNDLLWNQIRTNRVEAQSRLKLPGRILETPEIKFGKDKRWTAKGFVPKDQNSAQGPHLDNLLILVDEAAGVPSWLWVAIKGWMTNPNNKLIAIGNPNTEESYFREQFHSQLGRPGTRAIYINAHHSPNVTTHKDGTPKKPEELEKTRKPIPALVSDRWLLERQNDWGIDSIDYQTKALGEWPEKVDDERAIPMAWILAGFERTDKAIREGRLKIDEEAVTKLALDVARTGKDKCALGSLRGRYAQIDRYWDEPDTMQTALVGHLMVGNCNPKPLWLAIDGNAVGGGVVDRANQLRKEHPEIWGSCAVNEIDWGSTKADDKAKKKKTSKQRPTSERHTKTNVARLYHRLRRLLDPKRPEEELLYLPTEASLKRVGLTRVQFAAQLNARKCWWDEFGAFHVESKSAMKDRTKKMEGASSCDCADVLAMLTDDVVIKKRGLRFATR